MIGGPDANAGPKYAIIRLDKMRDAGISPELITTIADGTLGEFVEFGGEGDPEEFFVLKLKDPFTRRALMAYAGAAGMSEEYGLSKLALEYHNRCTKPVHKTGV